MCFPFVKYTGLFLQADFCLLCSSSQDRENATVWERGTALALEWKGLFLLERRQKVKRSHNICFTTG